ncbi:MAG TPA: glycosyltransferase, partial [bacterium]|nr:glycosyltransferase [bacterium]
MERVLVIIPCHNEAASLPAVLADVGAYHPPHDTLLVDDASTDASRQLAEAAGVPFVAFDKVVEAGVVEFLTQRRPDWLFVVGISQLVPAAVRDLAKLG